MTTATTRKTSIATAASLIRTNGRTTGNIASTTSRKDPQCGEIVVASEPGRCRQRQPEQAAPHGVQIVRFRDILELIGQRLRNQATPGVRVRAAGRDLASLTVEEIRAAWRGAAGRTS